MESIKEVAKAVHLNAINKGFWAGSVLWTLRKTIEARQKLSMSDLARFAETDEGTKQALQVAAWEIAARLALVHSEVSEALEELRCSVSNAFESSAPVGGDKPIGFASELADIVIRVMDLAEGLGIDIEREILLKHEYNTTREHRHGGKAL